MSKKKIIFPSSSLSINYSITSSKIIKIFIPKKSKFSLKTVIKRKVLKTLNITN